MMAVTNIIKEQIESKSQRWVFIYLCFLAVTNIIKEQIESKSQLIMLISLLKIRCNKYHQSKIRKQITTANEGWCWSKILYQRTSNQKSKANHNDRIIRLLKELSDENITFYMNAAPDLKIGFLRDTQTVDDYDSFLNFVNYDKNRDMYYSPNTRLRLGSYAP